MISLVIHVEADGEWPVARLLDEFEQTVTRAFIQNMRSATCRKKESSGRHVNLWYSGRHSGSEVIVMAYRKHLKMRNRIGMAGITRHGRYKDLVNVFGGELRTVMEDHGPYVEHGERVPQPGRKMDSILRIRLPQEEFRDMDHVHDTEDRLAAALGRRALIDGHDVGQEEVCYYALNNAPRYVARQCLRILEGLGLSDMTVRARAVDDEGDYAPLEPHGSSPTVP